ncbi:hypothetical protein [Bacillus sp. ISL-47]|uniref:hypothetical protein n=1 Tax=Bacillus sp. ISL-47 TaxID=2819130 RepID=UPI003339BA02
MCEEIDPPRYGLSGKAAIIEDKQTVLKNFGLRDGNWLRLWNIDSRLLTMFYQSLDSRYDWFIVVYDYEKFCIDREVKEAIIWHEVGHITYPVGRNCISLENEINCDHMAVKSGQKEGLKKVLDLTLDMARSLNNELLIKLTNERKERINAY